MSLFRFLQKPFPYQSSVRKRFWLSFGISMFVFLFLLIFQPFNLNEVPAPYRYLVISGYGAVCFVIVSLNLFLLPVIFPFWFREEKWTVSSEICIMLWNFATIGTGNLLYSAYLGFAEFTAYSFIYTQLITLAVGIIPVTIAVAVMYILHLKKNLKRAVALDEKIQHRHKQGISTHTSVPGQKIIIRSEQERENLLLSLEDLLYIQSARNYIEVFWRDSSGETRKALLRNSLKNAEQQLAGNPDLIRCHRSYIVNFRNVVKVTANAQGFRLFLEGRKESIPASKSYEDKLSEHLN